LNSKEYIEDCAKKIGKGKRLKLNEQQTTVLQGLLAGSVGTGRALSVVKKDVFEYGEMRLDGDLSVDEQVLPLHLDESMHVALQAILGMIGEMADITENVYLWFQGKGELDVERLKIDMGDSSFYASVLLSIIESDWEEIQEINRKKTDTLYEQNWNKD
jgi:hypothetical protein